MRVLVTVYIPANTMMKAPENMHKVSHVSPFPIHEFSVKTCEMICLAGNCFLNFDISQAKATNKPYPEEERKAC